MALDLTIPSPFLLSLRPTLPEATPSYTGRPGLIRSSPILNFVTRACERKKRLRKTWILQKSTCPHNIKDRDVTINLRFKAVMA